MNTSPCIKTIASMTKAAGSAIQSSELTEYSSSPPWPSWSCISWFVELREIFLELAAEAALRWLITMMVMMRERTMRAERTPMVTIVLVFIWPESSQ